MISFVRQLNAYGFHKVTDSTEGSEFFHPIFRKDGQDNIRKIQRKKSDRRKSKGTDTTPNEPDESGYVTPLENGDTYQYTIPTSSLQAYDHPYQEFNQSSYLDETVSPPTNHQKMHFVQMSMSIASSPVDTRAIKQGFPSFANRSSEYHIPVDHNNPQTTCSELIQTQLLNAILLEVQELKNNVGVIHTEVKKIREQNQETQNYMISILQQMFAPLQGSGNQGYLTLGPKDYYEQGSANSIARSSESLHSVSTKTYIPTPSAESSKVNLLAQGANAHLSQFVALSQVLSSHNTVQPVKSLDDAMTSPPTSDLLENRNS